MNYMKYAARDFKNSNDSGIAIGGAQKLGKGSALGPNGSRAGHGNGQKPP